MEFPADPWQHYGRVNEWSWLHSVTEHSSWKKSSFFLAYSFIGTITPPILQLKWFDVYYTASCILLCWQYYRLARIVGLGERASFIFVIIQALTFGNNVFGFYRYYGMSSSLFAQLGAVALTRLTIDLAQAGQKGNGPTSDRKPPFIPLFPPARTLLMYTAAATALVALTALNHVQGLGIAALGIAAVAVWFMIEWRRSMLGWLTLATLLLGVASVLWYPRHPSLDQVFRPQGWLTSWYGLNLFDPNSMAFSRGISLLGASGILSCLGGILLLRRNDVVGWLSIIPMIAMISPWCTIPLTNMIAAGEHGPDYIITFSRLFLTIPSGLSIIALINRLRIDADRPNITETAFFVRQTGLVAGVLLLGLLLVLVPPNSRFYNRYWHTMTTFPQDLEMRHVISVVGPEWPSHSYRNALPDIAANQGIRFVLGSADGRNLSRQPRSMGTNGALAPAAASIELIRVLLESKSDSQPAIFFLPSANFTFTPLSNAAYLSGHWLTQQVALEHSASIEIANATHRPVTIP